MPTFNSFLAAYAILATSAAQLITPANLPALSHNFNLIAHVTSPNITRFAAGIENWEVVALPVSGCHEPLLLRRPSGVNGSSSTSGTTFFFNPTTAEIQHHRGNTTRSLLIPKGGHGGRDLSMDCRKGTSHVGVAYVGDGPQLVHARNGTFYVCPRRVRGEAVAQLLYRQGGDEPLPYTCVDVTLFARLAKGREHGDESLVVCCTDVRDGVCVFPMHTAGDVL